MSEKILIAFYKGKGTWRDRVIRFFDREWSWFSWPEPGKVSHVEFVYDDFQRKDGTISALCIGASKREPSSALVVKDKLMFRPRMSKSVRVEAITFKKGNWEFFEVPGDFSLAQSAALGTLGKRYDFKGAIFSITPIDRHDPDKLFCSEQISFILKTATRIFFPAPHRNTPNSLYKRLKRAPGVLHHISAEVLAHAREGRK